MEPLPRLLLSAGAASMAIKGDYRIIYLSEDYSTTIIGRNKRDYVWLMARDHQMTDSEYDNAVRFISEAGYDTTKLQRVPQEW
jgi:apolipoprotein D and lipocalin family protein